jgi:hypothetical protein
MRRLAIILGLVLLAAPAQAFESVSDELTASDGCEAFSSFRKRSNPNGARLVPGERYRVLGRNEPDGAWLQILLPGTPPQQRGIDRTCGELGATVAAGPSGLLPFFDKVAAGPGDPSPPSPPLSALDRGVLAVCGAWGSHPRARDFRAMLEQPDVAPEMQALYDGLDRSVRGSQVPVRRFKDELTEVWFDAGGFAHVFCGEPRSDELRGLHYRGRYLKLQEQGLAGLLADQDCRAAEIEPPVYTVGVRYRLPGGGPLRSACPKGYAYDLDAADLLRVATTAWRKLRRQRGAAMCLEEITITVGDPYLAVVMARGDAVQTFYPDLTPVCDGGGRPERCACGG